MGKNILIIVDAQNDFCHVDGKLSTAAAAIAARRIAELLETSRFDKVVCTMDTHNQNYYSKTAEGRHLPVVHCIRGTWGWLLEENVYRALYGHDFEIEKKDHFSPTPDHLSAALGMMTSDDRVYLCGMCTDICVINTALTLKNMGDFEVYAIAECCAGTTRRLHEAALDVMESSHVNVVREGFPSDALTANPNNI